MFPFISMLSSILQQLKGHTYLNKPAALATDLFE